MSGISAILWLGSAIVLEIAWFIGRPLCGFKTWLKGGIIPLAFLSMIPGVLLLGALGRWLFS
jgi:hypothetical protein